MAVITEINGVSTSGTTGVNNIFGSGGGGSSSPSAAPTFTIGNATTYGGNVIFVTNSLSYTKPLFNLIVTDPSGTEIVSTAQDYEVTYSAGFYFLEWQDASTATGTFTINLSVVDVDASPEEVESSVTTATYTKASAQFKYIRVYGLNSSGDRGTGHTLTTLMPDLQLFEGTNLTGTQQFGFGNQNGPLYNTSNTSVPNWEISGGHAFNDYDFWEVNDNNSTNLGNAWWSLGRNTSAENYIQVKYLNQSENASSPYATDADIPLTKSLRCYLTTNGSATNYEAYGSTTGAFAGEEVQIGNNESFTSNGYLNFTL